MEAKCLRRRYPTGGETTTAGDVFPSRYDLRKKFKGKDGFALESGPKIGKRKGKCLEKSDNTSNCGKHTPLKFPRLSQKELMEIYGQKIFISSTNVERESEESDEDDYMLTEEQLKETDEYKSTMNGLDAIFGKPSN